MLLICATTLKTNCQTIEFSTTFYPLVVKSINDTPNPILIQAKGYDPNLATISINATQATAKPTFSFLRLGSNKAIFFANPSVPLFNLQSSSPNRQVLTIDATNNYVCINSFFSTPASANLEVLGTVQLGTNGTILNHILKVVINKDVPTIVASGTYTFNFGFSGLSVGSAVSVSTDLALDPKLVIAYAVVESANIVTIIITNISTTNAVDPPVMNFYVTAIN